jgi:hypothetical protein
MFAILVAITTVPQQVHGWSPHPHNEDKILARPSAGFIFQALRQRLYYHSRTYRLYVTVRYPLLYVPDLKPTLQKRISPCNTKAAGVLFCKNDQMLLSNLDNQYTQLLSTYYQTKRALAHFLNFKKVRVDHSNTRKRRRIRRHHRMPGRYRRGLFDAIGNGLSWLFGISTHKDTQQIKVQMNKIARQVEGHRLANENMAKQLVSYTHIANKRMTNLYKQVNLTTHVIGELYQYVRNNSKAIDDTQHLLVYLQSRTSLKLASLETISNLNILVNLQATYLSALSSLSRGHVSVALISPKIMKDHCQRIDAELQAHHEGYEIIYDSLQQIYNSALSAVHIYEGHVVIAFDLPIVRHKYQFKVYRVNAHPIPLTNASFIGYSQVETDVEYIAVSQDRSSYVHFSRQDWRECLVQENIVCQSYPPRIPATQSCIAAIITDNTEAFHRLCKHTVYPKAELPKVSYFLENSTYLILTHATKAQLTCPNFSKSVAVNHMFTVRIECNCRFEVESRLFSSPGPCKGMATGINIQYPINLAYLRCWNRSDIPMETIKPSDIFSETHYHGDIPDMAAYAISMADLGQADKDIAIDLNVLASAMKINSNTLKNVSFAGDLVPFLNYDENQSSAIFVMGIFHSAELLALILILYITRRMWWIRAAAILPPFIPPAQARTLTMATRPPVYQTPPEYLYVVISMNTYMTIATLTMTIALSIYIVQTIYKLGFHIPCWISKLVAYINYGHKRQKSSLFLMAHGDLYRLPIFLTHAMSKRKFVTTEYTPHLLDMQYTKYCMGGELKLVWSDTMLIPHPLGEERIFMPETVHVPWYVSSKLAHMMTRSPTVKCFLAMHDSTDSIFQYLRKVYIIPRDTETLSVSKRRPPAAPPVEFLDISSDTDLDR